MPVNVSMSSFFAGPVGALVMSMIAMSIVFLVIIGLMFVMIVTHKIAEAAEKTKAKKTPSAGGR
ncbi:MAG: OadG family protein [Synergistaceae bacterium]|nr:OadG family protein [Synergistaceae bacterium]